MSDKRPVHPDKHPDIQMNSGLKPSQAAIKSLLDSDAASVNDKLVTVKVAQHLDKDRFHSAFRSLMGGK